MSDKYEYRPDQVYMSTPKPAPKPPYMSPPLVPLSVLVPPDPWRSDPDPWWVLGIPTIAIVVPTAVLIYTLFVH